ncbi:Fe-S cluster assembly ATPase SufC, partial [Candidatus Microgenomates bacterium]|nr:Fe-S cluster assembly ATPase SufC [Candidatus Microgenomates bacterium]
MLVIKNLIVSTENKEILKGVSLTVKPGEIHALMGPNGAGKTSLAMALMGHANFQFPISNFQLKINGEDMRRMKPEERARQGLFVAFQSPIEVTGVSVLAFLRTAYKALHSADNIPLSEFKKQVSQALKTVGLDESFMSRYLNDGFSGGEKKRMEVAQLLILKPKFAILDEIDSGLDIDSLRVVAKAL